MFVRNKKLFLQNIICKTYKENITLEERNQKIKDLKDKQKVLDEIAFDLQITRTNLIMYIISIFILFLSYKVWNTMNYLLLETQFDILMNKLGNIAFLIGSIYLGFQILRHAFWFVQDIQDLYFVKE